MGYASQTDLANVGLSTNALGQLSQAQINATLQSASDYADTFFRARYGQAAVPFTQWDTSVTEAVAKIAAYRLVCLRGFNPNSAADLNFRVQNNDAVAWLNSVQRQQAHPLVTVAVANQPGSVQPNLNSFSVVNLANGGRAPTRGW
jgi:phage gp36-like protein